MRIGIGYDVHRLQTGRRLILGGVDIPHSQGLLGYSDADVLAHAIGDALLGAAALGDLGRHFPDDDQRFKDANSLDLLTAIVTLLQESGYQILNVDSTIAAQAPRLAPYIGSMCSNIATALHLQVGQVSVKATTTEQLGFEGRQEGISAQAVVLIEKISD
ncbi:MAG: 2-C-methyl-D-erythritol 2,4-cyclodiphosphate synthase [Syntrophomonadaceae bacterium]|jgi:2-C-methyl-D-erythritol 2,4-cyclodiphosphate synthase|nr:2-C-methyl-D-erythritol 2,4-cyclodiphosphate synthase [Bacillota bacterium]NLP23589.1 2-C-methyl-D-erythritol 2,4-cyclodiphosphate synthase [Syntrophomonadaceae bacterium]